MFSRSKKVLAIGIVAICLIVGWAITARDTVADGVVRQGVYVEELNISGMTESEAEEAISDYVDAKLLTKVKVDINGTIAETTLEDLGYKWVNTNLSNDAVNLGKRGNVIQRYKDRLDVANSGKVYELEMTIDKESITEGLKTLCKEYNTEAQDAAIEFLEDGGIEIIPERTGVVVNYEQTTTVIYDYINDTWDGKSEISIVADTTIDEPKYTTADLGNISETPMGSYYTTFATGSSYYNRNMNIKNGASLLHGSVIYPDEEFSLNAHLEPWTEENGYFPAGTYVDGGVQDSLGGGICQVSSTLYNALLLAEIEIVTRYPHSMSVSYVPLAADAALAGDYKDLVFKNNTDAPIYIQAIYEEGRITFNVYGNDTREEGRTVKYVSETVTVKEIEEEVEKDKTKDKDYEEIVEEGRVGYVAKLWKYVYQDGEEVDKILVNTSNYRMSPRKVIRGTKKVKGNKKDDEEETKQKDETPDVEKPTEGEEITTENVTEAPTEAIVETTTSTETSEE